MYKVIELEIDPTISGDTGVFEVAWVEYPAIEQELMYFGEQKFYKAPENVASKACRAIKENEERGNPAATQTGKIRAQQLCNRDEISLETVKRMKSYLERAATYYTGNYDDNGTISYDLWGGKPALEWVDGILKDLEMGIQDFGIQDFVKPGPTEDKDTFIGRCIAYVLKEGKTPDQAAGQCYGMWENREFAPAKVSFDWDGTLDTRKGRMFLEQELSRGSIIYIVSARNLTTKEMIDLAKEYGFPATHIYTTGSNKAKVEKIKELGIKRHYDNNFNVVRELGPVGIRFDYDIAGLPAYDNYPPSGQTDSMLTEPLPYEGCGCGQTFEGLEDACWEGYIAIGTKMVGGREVPNCVPAEMAQQMNMFPGQVAIIDGHPAFETIADAENHSIYIGCVGHHTHTTVEGNQIYMACEKHPEMDYSEYTTEDFEMKKQFDFLKQTVSPEEFEAITSPLLRGFTESEIYAKNHPTPVTYFQYKRKLSGSPDRDFCTSIENRWFRRAQIDMLRETNLEFGHERQPYSKWLYKGGPECVHAWYGALFQGKNKADKGYAEGKAGQAPQELPNRGYYSAETRRKSQVAYIISQQNMNSVSYMKDIQCAFGDVCKPKFDKQEQLFAAKDEERMIYTPLMIPDILIPRIDEVSNEKYYVKFTPETIKNIRDKFMAELRNRMTNYEHTDKKFEDIVMVETWIVQGEKDKAYELGFTQEQVPFGTWMGAYKVLDTPEGNIVWNKYIKPGKVRGASVEGNFILNFSQQRGDEYLLEQVINIIKQITD